MENIYVKSLFGGWRKVTKEQADKWIKYMLRGIMTNMSNEERTKYINSKLKGMEVEIPTMHNEEVQTLKPNANKGKFKIGTKFIANINKEKFEVTKIENKPLMTASGNIIYRSTSVTIKDLKTGKLFSYGLQALERCNITIIDSE